jgi:hypothetical protein
MLIGIKNFTYYANFATLDRFIDNFNVVNLLQNIIECNNFFTIITSLDMLNNLL